MQIDSIDVVLGVVVFMCIAGALPSEEEIRGMSFSQILYAVPYRFLQLLCVNIRAVNPSLGAISQKVDVSSVRRDGTVTKQSIETTSVNMDRNPHE